MEKQHKDRLKEARCFLPCNVGDVMGVIEGVFAKHLITQPMKEKIVQGNKADSDKLRALMDLLLKRGPEVFDAFYDVLIEQGEFDAADYLRPELKGQHTNIALSQTGDDALPKKWPDHDAHDPEHIEVSLVTHKQMIQNFENAYSGDISKYPMWRETRGIFLLINNQKFDAARAAGIEMGDRPGTECDRSALKLLFKKLYFDVIIEDNRSAKQIADTLKEVAGKSHRDFDCFACAILSHGKKGVVYGVDGNKISIKDIIGAMDGANCPTLVGKPKLFFVQACQGNKRDKGVSLVELGGAAEDKPTGDDVSTVANHMNNMTMQDAVQHKEELDVEDLYNVIHSVLNVEQSDDVPTGMTGTKSDIFLGMSTQQGYGSSRFRNAGSLFIQAVAFIFSKFAHEDNLCILMTKVNLLLNKAEIKRGYKQVSGFETTLTKNLYFFPGLKKSVPSTRPGTRTD